MSDIVERLREEAEWYFNAAWIRQDGGNDYRLSGRLADEAADEIERLRNLYKETCEEKNKEIFEWIEHSKQLVLNSLPWQEENARLREMVKYFACHCGGACDRSDDNCLISQAALGKEKE